MVTIEYVSGHLDGEVSHVDSPPDTIRIPRVQVPLFQPATEAAEIAPVALDEAVYRWDGTHTPAGHRRYRYVS